MESAGTTNIDAARPDGDRAADTHQTPQATSLARDPNFKMAALAGPPPLYRELRVRNPLRGLGKVVSGSHSLCTHTPNCLTRNLARRQAQGRHLTSVCRLFKHRFFSRLIQFCPLDAPFRCPHTQAFYTSSPPSFISRKPRRICDDNDDECRHRHSSLTIPTALTSSTSAPASSGRWTYELRRSEIIPTMCRSGCSKAHTIMCPGVYYSIAGSDSNGKQKIAERSGYSN